ncbi:hypothetical protein F5Y10DRAFT_146114 [Nemania abortiva]|nr:hypothetical protein F5Y10DRAFT_146114 [Nemania abortiva]
MCQSALNSAIRHNTALGNAIQFNIQVFAPFLGDLKPDQTMFEFLKTLVNQDLFSRSLPQKEHNIKPSRDLGAHEPVGAGLDSPRLLRTYFPTLATFRNDWLDSIRDYRQYSSSAIEVLQPNKVKSIATWLSSSSHEILLIDVNDERGESSWTTDLLLEMIGVFEAANVVSKSSYSAIITHFYRKNPARESYGEETLLQDFLVQIIEAYPERFEHAEECQQDGITVANLCSAANNPEELWDLIVRCIKRTRIRMLVIMLDHVEEMFLQNFATTGPDGFQQFVKQFQNNIRILHENHGIVVKTMVTCRLDAAAYYFYETGATTIVMRNPPRRWFDTGD